MADRNSTAALTRRQLLGAAGSAAIVSAFAARGTIGADTDREATRQAVAEYNQLRRR